MDRGLFLFGESRGPSRKPHFSVEFKWISGGRSRAIDRGIVDDLENRVSPYAADSKGERLDVKTAGGWIKGEVVQEIFR